MMRPVPPSILGLLLAFTAAAPQPGRRAAPVFEICGTVSDYRPGKSIYLALYTGEEDFRKRNYLKALRFTGDRLPPDSVRYCFCDVAAGEYMIACYQDINGDGKLNYGMFGSPVEPYCFFRPFTGVFRPHFDDCSFTVAGPVHDADFGFRKPPLER